MMSGLRIRIGAVCCEKGSILLVEHEKDGMRYWLLPGGGLKADETMETALVREVAEETSVTVQANRLLCICESISPDRKRHIVHFLYKAHRVCGSPGASRDPRVRGSSFIPLDQLDNLVLYPPIEAWLVNQLTTKSPEIPEYLGAMWI